MTEIIKISVYRDGGTSAWIEPLVKESIKTVKQAKEAKKYYLDNRIGSMTKGELYDRYPSEKDAKILDKTKFRFLEDNEK
jgi:hypothetical protein